MENTELLKQTIISHYKVYIAGLKQGKLIQDNGKPKGSKEIIDELKEKGEEI